MDEFRNEDSLEPNGLEDEEFELSHSDKIMGVFTEPSNIFSRIAAMPIKTVDWLLPLVFFVLAAILSNVLMMSNETIRYAVLEKQLDAVEKSMDEAVASGDMTQAQADARLEQTRGFMENSTFAMIIQIFSMTIGIPIFYFIVCGLFYLLAKFALKGDGGYTSSMVSYSMPLYIAVLHSIVTVIAALAMSKFLTGINLADFLDLEKTEFLGFIISKVDPFSIWFYAVFSIALAKMFKSESSGKYFGVVFGMWIGFSLLIFYLSKSLSFLQGFN